MSSASPQQRFWKWFLRNGEHLRAAMYGKDEAARDEAASELREAVEEVEPGLVLEIGSDDEGRPWPLIVSADGKPDRVDAVKDFVASAPELPGWNVIAFRPRLQSDDLAIVLGDEQVAPADVWFHVEEGEAGLDLTLHVRGLTEENQQMRGLGASLLAEHSVGERDALTLIGSLAIQPLTEDAAAAGLRPFGELVGVFDAAKAGKYPPPGSLPIDLDGEWQGMRGTINGSPAMILLHAGLGSVAGHPDYDRRLTVSILFNDAREDGMPGSEEEYLAVQELGDRVTELLREGQESLLSMTLMTQGRRDLVFYTSNADAALARLDALPVEARTHGIETDIERDTFWGMYRHFSQAAEQSETEEE